MSKQKLFFKQLKAWCCACLVLAVLLFASAQPGHAEPQGRLLDQPRAAGIAGERYDGFAVLRGSATPEVAELVDRVNAERRALYAQRSAKEGIPLEAVGKIYAAEIIKSAPSGTWFLSESGQWSRK